MLKNGDRAGEYFRILNPIEHTRTKESVLRYKVEPYVMAADVYASPNMQGRGGWTWYTGSSSWFYIAGIEYVLGLNKKNDILKINPCIPHEWEQFTVEYMYMNTMYEIVVKNPEHKANGFRALYLDNDFVNNNEIKLVDDEKKHTIEYIM